MPQDSCLTRARGIGCCHREGRLDLASSSKGADVSLVLRGDPDVVRGRSRPHTSTVDPGSIKLPTGVEGRNLTLFSTP